ncbi:acetyl-CoA C-acetyltransferase [Salsuginibacillus halophilus]|uniref:Acetyl-CoA C-acetyltransferase n=1 Tax=Salsuginibacillus halophilus TaxID=517424 RepID=A0A2P8HKW5_9BACI|nr:thiolase family protein [Salsuginibacillus halophilus]PSL46864.1 acetyl-CoA C-acetyltransferase [Salsuginibacillus halophilus]
MNEAVIVLAKRTPIGLAGGIYKHIEPEHLAAPVLQKLCREAGVNGEEIDEVMLGNAVGPGGNIARKTVLTAGLPAHVPGVTVDRQCGSGLEAVITALRHVQAGAGSIYLAGGLESTSRAPWRIEKPGSLYDTPPNFYSRAAFAPESTGDPEMGVAAENVAEAYQISREAQDSWSVRSHHRAAAAQENGVFESELVLIPGTSAETDEGPRPNISRRLLQRMPPAFREGGTVTAGNACAINDGAAAALVMSKAEAEKRGFTSWLTFVDAASAGVDPKLLGVGPVPAVQKLFAQNGWHPEDLARVEFNEAFASQVLASLQELEIPVAVVNQHGGAIAFGHPYGASGAVLITRLLADLQRGGKTGDKVLAALGIGGGLGTAGLFTFETNGDAE